MFDQCYYEECQLLHQDQAEEMCRSASRGSEAAEQHGWNVEELLENSKTMTEIVSSWYPKW